MAVRGRQVFAALAIWAALATSQAAADQIGIAFVTCINNNSSLNCIEQGNGPVWWRVVNRMEQYDSPFAGSNDLRDVTLDFRYQGGSVTAHWDVLPATPSCCGFFGETSPFDASLMRQLISLTLTATMSRTVFDPLYSSDPYLRFTANSSLVSATATQFPPPLGVYAAGTFETLPTPEPASLTLVGFGLAGLYRARARKRQAWEST